MGNVLIIGDTHFSPKQHGRHKDYMASSLRLMQHLQETAHNINNESGLDGIIILGDIFGVSETILSSKHPTYTVALMAFFRALNTIAPVYAVKGNHDMNKGGSTTWDAYHAGGLIRHPKHIDHGSVRYHIQDYGHDTNPSYDIKEDAINIVCAHGEFATAASDPAPHWMNPTIVDINPAYQNIDAVISGHIHTPAPPHTSTHVSGGKDITLLYPGSPARTHTPIPDVYYILITSQGDMSLHPLGLWPLDEEFNPTDTPDAAHQDADSRTLALQEALQDAIGGHINTPDLLQQLESIASSIYNITPQGYSLARTYLTDAINN